MKKLLILSLAVLTCGSTFAQKKVKPPVEGRIYSLTLTEEKESKKKAPEPFKDEIAFIVNVKFKSTFMMNAGFSQTDYTFEVDSSSSPVTIKWSVEAKNDANGRFSWEGTITDDAIEGTAVIRKKGKIEHTYNFTGTWKNKKKPKPAPKPAAVPATTDSTLAPPPVENPE